MALGGTSAPSAREIRVDRRPQPCPMARDAAAAAAVAAMRGLRPGERDGK